MEEVKFSDLVGLTLTAVRGHHVGSERLTLETQEGRSFVMYHSSDCCESVDLNDVAGDIADLVGNPLVQAEEASNSDDKPSEYADSWTWTFYKLATVKGSVTLRWLGESNGYYSERVCFEELSAPCAEEG